LIRIIINSLLSVLCIEVCATLYADVAPPIYPGYSLSPFDARNVRMKSQKVDIYYGSTCKIEAVFEIVNPTKAIVEKKIGFPINLLAMSPRGRDTGKIYDFALSLNGETLKETDVPADPGIRSDRGYWYGWTCKFKPDRNIVKLTYHTVASFGGSGYRWENTLCYFLNSDKNWPEKIETVQVTVHFPERIAKRQILAETSPPGYELKENEIVWHFTSFTPDARSNIVLHIIDFKFFADMLRYEEVLSPSCKDNAKKLQAAKFFASLAPLKGIQISIPHRFNRSYYDSTVIPNLTSTEKPLFDSLYELHKDPRGDFYINKKYSYYEKIDSSGRKVLDVMYRIGYFDKIAYPIIYKYIEGAKKLFGEVVASEPKNEAAWIAYINNYYLIETGACSPCLQRTGARADYPESQKELIREAFRNCGNNSTIAIWNNYLFPACVPLPDTLESVRYEKPQENVTIKLKHEGGGWQERILSPDELSLLKKAYTMSVDVYFVLNHTQVDQDTQKKLVDILGGHDLYWNKFCRDLYQLRKRGK
jgi:hypothetical protein